MSDDAAIAVDERNRTVPGPYELAPSAAHRSFANRLLEVGLGHSEEQAEAIAAGLVMPREAQRSLATPKGARRPFPLLSEIRTPSGHLLVLDALVWATHLSTWPTNTRAASEKPFPVAELESRTERARFRPLPDPDSSSAGAPGLTLAAASREQLSWSFDRLATYLKQHNTWQESIREQGVMSAVTALPLVVEHEDGAESLSLLATPDGSSRTSSCHENLGELTSKLAYLGDRRRRQIIGDVLRGLDEQPESEAALDRGYSLVVPARIVLGFVPDQPGSCDLARAINFYVGQIHIEPPTKWDEDGQNDAKAASVLDALEEADVISSDRRHYLWGDLTADQAAEIDGCFPQADERAIDIILQFTSQEPATKRAVSDGIRQLSPKTRIHRNERVGAAVELALHAVRPHLKKSDYTIARTALKEIFAPADLWDPEEIAVTGRTPEEIRDAALAEDAENELGPSTQELAALASYHLATTKTLRGARFFESDADRDGRNASSVIEQMIRAELGIHALYQAVVDGRANREPRQVNDAGAIPQPVDGSSNRMTDVWLRQTFTTEAPPEASLTAKVQETWKVIRQGIVQLDANMEILKNLRDESGAALVLDEGLPMSEVEQVRDRLGAHSETLLRYGLAADTTDGQPS